LRNACGHIYTGGGGKEASGRQTAKDNLAMAVIRIKEEFNMYSSNWHQKYKT
jgi:hypothetical protein